MNKRIKVKEEHIQIGKARVSTECPVEWALRDAFGDDLTHSVVAENYIGFSLRSTGMRYRHMLPRQVMAFVVAVDGGRPVEPFTFVLDDSDTKNRTLIDARPIQRRLAATKRLRRSTVRPRTLNGAKGRSWGASKLPINQVAS